MNNVIIELKISEMEKNDAQYGFMEGNFLKSTGWYKKNRGTYMEIEKQK